MEIILLDKYRITGHSGDYTVCQLVTDKNGEKKDGLKNYFPSLPILV